MKKVFALLLVAGMFAVVSCGPSAEEKAKKEQATKDSLAQIATADSLAKVAAEQATADSLKAVATADSIKAAEEAGAKGAKGAKTTAKTTAKKETVGTKVDKAVEVSKSVRKH